MQNINELFDNRDMIIESMGYFNPLILEENAVVLSEGFIGGIVEKIKALGRIIQGWIQKLINWVAGKFSRGGGGGGGSTSSSSTTTASKASSNKKADTQMNEIKEISDKIDDMTKTKDVIQTKNKEIDKKIDKLEDEVKKMTDAAVEKATKSEYMQKRDKLLAEIGECKEEVKKWSNKLTELPKKVEEQKKKLNDLRRKSIDQSLAKVKIPDLRHAKYAINDAITDCRKAIASYDPYGQFKGKSIQKYFLNSGNDKEMTAEDFLKDDVYKSYSHEAGKECIDQLRKYQKKVEDIYKKMENDAKNADETEAKKILDKAKSVNAVSQKVIKTTLDWLNSYVTKITNLRSSLDVDNRNIKSAIDSAENKLMDMTDTSKNGYYSFYRDKMKKAMSKVEQLNGELNSLNS